MFMSEWALSGSLISRLHELQAPATISLENLSTYIGQPFKAQKVWKNFPRQGLVWCYWHATSMSHQPKSIASTCDISKKTAGGVIARSTGCLSNSPFCAATPLSVLHPCARTHAKDAKEATVDLFMMGEQDGTVWNSVLTLSTAPCQTLLGCLDLLWRAAGLG